MKMTMTMLGVGIGMVAAGLAEPVQPEPVDPLAAALAGKPGEPDRGLYVFPKDRDMGIAEMKALLGEPAEDPMLQKLMGEMLKEAEQDRKEMEAPVEFPKLDAPELLRLLEEMGEPRNGPPPKRWALGAQLRSEPGDRIVVAVVTPDSPAEEAGLQAGDVLDDLNGIRLRDRVMLVELLQVIRDQEVELGLRRNGEDLRVKIAAREMDLPDVHAWKIAPPDGPLAPKPDLPTGQVERDDEVLRELRAMHELMEEMLKELRNPAHTPGTRVRRVPAPPQN